MNSLFPLLHNLRLGGGATKGEEDVDVISHATGLDGGGLYMVQNPDDVSVQSRTYIGRDERFAVFGAEDQMDQDA
jgi:hypothetical protein